MTGGRWRLLSFNSRHSARQLTSAPTKSELLAKAERAAKESTDALFGIIESEEPLSFEALRDRYLINKVEPFVVEIQK